MKRIFFILILLCLEKALHAQTPYVYTIKADSVKITNSCDTAELIIENHTQNVLGFLFNKGKGRTEFRRANRLNDSMLVVGGDTLIMRGKMTANNGLNVEDGAVQLGQSLGAAGNPAALRNNREIPMNGDSLNLFNGYLNIKGAPLGDGRLLDVNCTGPTRKSATVTGASYSVPADIDVVFVNYAAGQATISLPTGTLDREITIKNLSTANTVIISGLDTNESNNVATRGAITVKYTGSAWVGISKY